MKLKKSLILLGCVIFLIAMIYAEDKSSDADKYWAQWRGPLGTGFSPYGNPPIEWSENKNVKWKIEIPGKGHSTPIIWGDQLFITTAIETEKVGKAEESKSEESSNRGWMRSSKTSKVHKFTILSIDRDTGKVQWQTTVKEEVPEESTHEFGSWASNSPVTDGEHVYAYFGSRGLFCLDMKGNVKWERDFGQMSKRMSFGEGSSPALYDDKVIVTWDHEGESFIVAMDKKTGEDVWKVERDEGTSWSTPLIINVSGTRQVIVSATNRIRAYDFITGRLIWECSGMTDNVIPHPVAANGIVYIMSGYRGSALLAIDLSRAKGDITGTDAIVWKYDKDTSYTPSPVLIDGKIYFFRVNNGDLSCLDAKDGRVYYSKEKLEGLGNVFTSPVSTKEYLFVMGGTGTGYVIRLGSELKIVSKNELEDSFHASPAIVGDSMYLRGFKYLYCIASE